MKGILGACTSQNREVSGTALEFLPDNLLPLKSYNVWTARVGNILRH